MLTTVVTEQQNQLCVSGIYVKFQYYWFSHKEIKIPVLSIKVTVLRQLTFIFQGFLLCSGERRVYQRVIIVSFMVLAVQLYHIICGFVIHSLIIFLSVLDLTIQEMGKINSFLGR